MKTQYSPLVLAVMAALSCNLHAAEKDMQKDEHDIETLLITASPLKRTVLQSSTPVDILSGEELDQHQAATLGETLKNIPGVNSSYFGPVSSSPIIRGLDGPRIKVVQNGLDASDASRVGPDHSVSTEVSTATQVEVLRGPATLLYGSGAIGGVVNVVDERLPQQTRDDVSGEIAALYDSVSDEKTVSSSVNGGLGQFAWHLDAFSRKTGNYEIPGEASVEEHAEEEAEHDESSGYLPNSAIDAQGFTLGTAWISDDFRLAMSYGRLESDYGVPGHAHHDEEHEEDHEDEHSEETEEAHTDEESVYASLQQNRFQAVADWTNLAGLFNEIHWHNGYTDYQHSEIEDGAVGTTFTNQTFESRLWAQHQAWLGWQGVIGLHYNNIEFSAQGDEAFTPPTDSKSIALFVLEEKKSGNLLWQLGTRIERVSHQPDNAFFAALSHEHEDEAHQDEHDDEHGIYFDQQNYTAISASAGVVWTLNAQQSVAFNYAFSERAPSASEIFANGPHIGTGTYEVGGGFALHNEDGGFVLEQASNPMDKELSNNLDLSYRYHSDNWSSAVSLFYNQVDNYVFQQDTGLVISDGILHAHEEEADDHVEEVDEHGHDHGEDLPVFLFSQQDARLYGFEAEIDWHVNENWRVDAFTDYTRAKLDDGSNVPRIPPFRIGTSLHYEYNEWHAEADITRYAKQDKIAEYETQTAGYTLVSASVNYYLPTELADLTLFVKGDNLTNQEARVHPSFIKDVAPLPGRSIRIGIKARF